jgi:hypothetical protein
MRKLLFTLFLFFSLFGSLQAAPGRINNELGFWFGGSNPMPGTELDRILDSNVGMGGFYRVNWPWVFHLEGGFSYSYYTSRTTAKVTVMPVYGAVDYLIPIPWKLQTFFKLGGGYAYLNVRPDNKEAWEPMGFAGLEFSLLATRHFRIGLRIDYNVIYENYNDKPTQNDYITYWQLSRGYIPTTYDPRYNSYDRFRLKNGAFFHFGIMMSFIL